MKNIALTLTITAGLLGFSLLSYAQSVSVSPSRAFFKGEPGKTVSQLITFHNSSSEAINFVGRLQDFKRDSVGAKVYYPPGSLAESNASWISLSSNTINIPPNSSKQLVVSLSIPASRQIDFLSHSMLFFTQVKEQGNIEQKEVKIGVNVLFEFGIQIYYTPPGLKNGDVSVIAFKDNGNVLNGKDTVRNVAVKIVNQGASFVDANVRFEITNAVTGEELKLKTRPIAMLPKADQWVPAELPANLHGQYMVVAIVDSGSSNDLKVAKKQITYP